MNHEKFHNKLNKSWKICNLKELQFNRIGLTFDFPSSCFFVIVGGKFLNKIGSVMEKVDSITNDIGGTRPIAVFIISNTNKDNIVIDINHSFDRYKSTPVMVLLKILR